MMPEIVKLPEKSTPSNSVLTTPTDSLNTKADLLPELYNLPNLYNSMPHNTISVSFEDIRLEIGPSASGLLVARLMEVLRHAYITI